MSVNILNQAVKASIAGYPNQFPEDVESVDKKAIMNLIGKYMDDQYPAFDPEIVHALDKDYYLPALKVLLRSEGELFSPNRVAEWKDGELIAECVENIDHYIAFQISAQMNKIIAGSFGLNYTEPVKPERQPYQFPHEGCGCGIYGSVNLEEIEMYMHEGSPPGLVRTRPIQGNHVLCMIEPAEDSNVILSRKGWRAGAAFVSEIVGETITVEDASTLLSIAWHRNIDLRRLYENR